MPSSEQQFNFNHLSVKDLVEARDMFHVHLINKKNVIATAIGRYLIRTSDLDSNGKIIIPPKSARNKPARIKQPRTLENSMVIDISWPCVLVFVDEWESEKKLLDAGSGNIVPKTIYMPDGRMVPVCVVEAPKQHAGSNDVDIEKLNFPVNFVGGGFPLLINSQGRDNIATIGCVVSDGHKFYALTNKHVVGDPGEIIETKIGDERTRIGVSSGNSLGKMKFSQMYPGWDDKNMLVSCDAGLIEIDDINRWKTDIIGLPPGQSIDELFDLNTFNITTGLIAEHKILNGKIQDSQNGRVICYGSVSGLMKGEIAGLFYRYKSVGGIDYVSDFIIAGRNGTPLNVGHGDSGAVWLLETTDDQNNSQLRPVALHWGQHTFLNANQRTALTYSLSTCLSNICRELDVALVRGWNVDNDYSWGKVGHYTVGSKAVDAINVLKNADLKKLMKANIENISFRDTDINKTLAEKGNPELHANPEEGFCPLADVPDIIWKQAKKYPGSSYGTKWGRKGDENPNHYADVDAPVIGSGKNMFDLCPNPASMTIKTWQDFYKNIDKKKIGLPADKEVSQGLVCFRVWQIYNYMVDAVVKKKKAKFIYAAGVLAHYVGDACQPLHASYMSDGKPADSKEVDYEAKKTSYKKDGTVSHYAGEVYKKVINPGSGVHVAYEDHMIDDYIDDILPAISGLLKSKSSKVNKEAILNITSGQEAAFAVLTLMKLTQRDIPPAQIVEAYKAAKGSEKVSAALYQKFGKRTVDCMARGCRYLAAIWEAAWKDGNSKGGKIASLTKVPPQDLIDLYSNPKELPSKHLDTIAPYLK